MGTVKLCDRFPGVNYVDLPTLAAALSHEAAHFNQTLQVRIDDGGPVGPKVITVTPGDSPSVVQTAYQGGGSETIVRTPLGTSVDQNPAGIFNASLFGVSAAAGDVILLAQNNYDPGDGSGFPDAPVVAGQTFTIEDYAIGNLFGLLMARLVVTTPFTNQDITIAQTVATSDGIPPTHVVIVASKYAGLTATPADVVGSSDGIGTSPTATSQAAAIHQAHELLVGWVGTNGRASDAAGVWALGFTAGQRAGTAALAGAVYEGFRFVNALGSYQMQLGSMTSRNWHCLVNTYKAA